MAIKQSVCIILIIVICELNYGQLCIHNNNNNNNNNDLYSAEYQLNVLVLN